MIQAGHKVGRRNGRKSDRNESVRRESRASVGRSAHAILSLSPILIRLHLSGRSCPFDDRPANPLSPSPSNRLCQNFTKKCKETSN